MLNVCSQFYRKCDVRKDKDNSNPKIVMSNMNVRTKNTMACDCKPKEEDENVRRQMSRRPRRRRQRKTSKMIAYLSIKSKNCKIETCNASSNRQVYSKIQSFVILDLSESFQIK